ncbi:MAG: tRNA (5-methylaminomethyl-2-thiouridine)(34)-methyltransferase MnmD [Haliscomenobacter sp.]
MPDTELFETQDGSHSLLSRKYGVSYHSRYGAIQESLHVFIREGLLPLLALHRSLSVLEMGFGTGLNALLTLKEAQSKRISIWYEAIEAHPLSTDEATALNYPQLLGGGDLTGYFSTLHSSPWDIESEIAPFFALRKRALPLEECTFSRRFDLIYYDAFAPEAQPELWEDEALKTMFEVLNEGGKLVTYCAKGSVKRRLKALGFSLETLAGPPGKREMVRATRP